MSQTVNPFGRICSKPSTKSLLEALYIKPKYPRFVSVNQIEFSLTQFNAMHNGTLDQMLLKRIQPMFWSPLGKTFKEATEQTSRIQEELNHLCEKYHAEPSTLLLSWILQHPAQGSPVIGTTNKDRILAANKALEITLELEDWFALLVASQGHKVP